MNAEVLVVGAGPTGLMLANQLGRRRVRTAIVDRHPGPALQTRALAVQARTLEIYSKLGVADRALELGKRAGGANMWARGRRMARVPLGDMGRALSPFPFVLMLGQDDNERILGERLRDWNLPVQWSTELVGLEQFPDRVAATLKLPDGTIRKVEAAWVAGCDGARSAVRELSGIEFPGAPYEHVFFVADVEVAGSMVANELNVYLLEQGFHLFFPMRGDGHWRIVGILPPGLRGGDDLAFEDVVPFLRHEAGTALTFRRCSWFSTYRIHHRCAERFRDRRCFLLGDAAHIHSPVGGQGMNTGLQDAYNLGWKLGLVASGGAGDALLDSYEAERLPVARNLLATTDRLFSLIVSDNRTAALFRTRIAARILALAMRFERIRKLAFLAVSQTGIAYPGSPLSATLPGAPRDGPRAGERFPWLRLAFQPGRPAEDLFEKLDDTRFNLLVAGQPVHDTGVGEAIDIFAIPDDEANRTALAQAGISGAAFYLLRPDGHVGLAGGRLDAAGRDEVLRYHCQTILRTSP